jgi:protocatechuate 3,4-dioxygenase beta subunit
VVDATGAPVASATVTIGTSTSLAPAPAASRAPRPPAWDPMLTDASGQFFFRDLTPGRYFLTASKLGWLGGGFGRRRPGEPAVPIEIGEGERRGSLSISLWRPAIITGRVTDDTGDPLINAEVRAVRQIFVAGRAQNDTPIRLKTDDRGVYRFASLLPGDYVIAVLSSVLSEPAALTGAMSAVGNREYLQTMLAIGTAPIILDRATGAMPGNSRTLVGSLSLLPSLPAEDGAWKVYPTTYHPGSMTRRGARLVRVAAGETRADVDVLVRLTDSWQVSGTLMAPDGPAAWHGIHLVQAETADIPLVDVSTAVTDQSGAFTFHGVPPGQYIARVVKIPWPTGPGARLGIAGGTGAIPSVANFSAMPPADAVIPVPTEPLLHASESVTVASRHVRDLLVTMRPGPRVTGRAHFEGSAALPTEAEWRAMEVYLEPANGRQEPLYSPGRFGEDGRFATPSLWPGRYLIRGGGPSRWTLKSVTVGGREVADIPVDISTDLDNVVITFTDKKGEIAGTVRDPNNPTNVHATVLLFPDDPAAWVDYGRVSRRVASASADPGGRFTLTMPPDGGYCLIAIRDEDADNWRNPEFLARLARSAERLQIRGDTSLTRSLQVVSIR